MDKWPWVGVCSLCVFLSVSSILGCCTSVWPATQRGTCTFPTWRTPGSFCPWRCSKVGWSPASAGCTGLCAFGFEGIRAREGISGQTGTLSVVLNISSHALFRGKIPFLLSPQPWEHVNNAVALVCFWCSWLLGLTMGAWQLGNRFDGNCIAVCRGV